MKTILAVIAMLALTGMAFPNHSEAAGREESITGTVVDTYCLVTMNMGGKSHVRCATTCAKSGSPLAIKEEKTGVLYLASGQKNMLYASTHLEKYLEQRVTVRGKVYERDGVKMIVVESASPAK